MCLNGSKMIQIDHNTFKKLVNYNQNCQDGSNGSKNINLDHNASKSKINFKWIKISQDKSTRKKRIKIIYLKI